MKACSRGDDFVVETEKSVTEKFEDFVRAAAEDDVLARQAELCVRALRANNNRRHRGKDARWPSASRIAAIAFGEGPSGFSFEASLMMLAASAPSSRAVSSIGFPGS